MKYTIKEEYLRSKDKKLKNIIDKNGHIVLKPSKANQFIEGIVLQLTSTCPILFLIISKNLLIQKI